MGTGNAISGPVVKFLLWSKRRAEAMVKTTADHAKKHLLKDSVTLDISQAKTKEAAALS